MKGIKTMETITIECGCTLQRFAWEEATCKHGRIFTKVDRVDGSWTIQEVPKPPIIVCLCGSTRFSEAFRSVNLEETLSGKIVLTVGCDTRSDDDLFAAVVSSREWERVKRKLDLLHFRKIDLADEVLILNVGGYIGESTARELAYARAMGKKIRFLEGDNE